ncbi:MAG: serine/threonine protein kinase [Oligoflexia bacterium]|nr:serine/threonine protein kinase [Oligoflexia bacterium]
MTSEMTNTTSVWGDAQTRFFFDLTPDRVLDAVEASGLHPTGRCAALNSFENRVYDVELEAEGDFEGRRRTATELLASRRVVKFYRPGRWNQAQILEEHEFLLDLNEAEIPVVAPLSFADGKTLHYLPSGIGYAVFPKVGGRAPEEMSPDQLRQIGRLLARIHQVGAKKKALHRIELNPDTYGRQNLKALIDADKVPLEFRNRYESAVLEICSLADRLFRELPEGSIHRIHGDCHLGNLLWSPSGPFFLDFDDMVRGPAVQDIWLLVPGRDQESLANRQHLLDGYEEMRHFDYSSLRLVEPLRALRFVHYSAWIARRWDDPAFPLAFPHFGSHRYWADETHDMEEQLRLARSLG